MNNSNMIMAWNTPGHNDKKDNKSQNLWEQKPNKAETGPPDLEAIFRKLTEKFKNFLNTKKGKRQGAGKSPRVSGPSDLQGLKHMGGIALVVILVLYVISGIYIVDPPERAVITRFGKYARTLGPGPHWYANFIEKKEIVNIERVLTSDHSGLMLTSDRNIASVGIAVQYRIGSGVEDVRSYLFNVINPIHSLKLSAESALRQVVGQSTMDEVLTLKRSEIALAIKEQLIETLKNYDTGILVLDVVTQFAKAPDEVRAAFDDVIKAAADEERLVNQARAYENEVLPRARGTVESLKNEAQGYKQETVLWAEGNVARFNLILAEYQKAPKVTQTRLYLETLSKILSDTTKVIVEGQGNNHLLYLPWEKLIPPKVEQPEEINASKEKNL